ncbi:MAG: HDOD domain-containing protein [Sandaracinaceae bacterium]
MVALRALIVDDDVAFGAALSRALTRYDVQATCVPSVQGAVAHLARDPVDVMILDLRLPEIGGITFLKQLAARGLTIPVVAISGFARVLDRRELARLGAPLVEKPFAIKRLVVHLTEVTGRVLIDADATVGRAPNPDDEVRRILRGVSREIALGQRDLPVLDPRVEQAQLTLRGPDPQIEAVLAIVGEDPVLCASLIRAANVTVLTGDKIRTVAKAVVRLGAREAIDIVLGTLMKQSFPVGSGPYRDVLDRMWRTSLATARLAHWLAQETPGLDPDEMRLAGLVHNAGELLLLTVAAQLPASLRMAVPMTTVLEEIGHLHEPVGELLLDAWRMPSPLPRWAGRHHGADLLPGPALLELAWRLAVAYGFTYLPAEPVASDEEPIDPLDADPALEAELDHRRVSREELADRVARLKSEILGDGADGSDKEASKKAVA